MTHFLGGTGRADIRGMFRDTKGKVLLQFSKEFRVDLVVYMGLLTFREEILITAALRWTSSHSFLF